MTGGEKLLYRVSVCTEADDPQEIKEALTLKLEELGFSVGGALVTVEPVEFQVDFLELSKMRDARDAKRSSAEQVQYCTHV